MEAASNGCNVNPSMASRSISIMADSPKSIVVFESWLSRKFEANLQIPEFARTPWEDSVGAYKHSGTLDVVNLDGWDGVMRRWGIG